MAHFNLGGAGYVIRNALRYVIKPYDLDSFDGNFALANMLRSASGEQAPRPTSFACEPASLKRRARPNLLQNKNTHEGC